MPLALVLPMEIICVCMLCVRACSLCVLYCVVLFCIVMLSLYASIVIQTILLTTYYTYNKCKPIKLVRFHDFIFMYGYFFEVAVQPNYFTHF